MKLVDKKYFLPFALITSLFFMWGFARATLDVLNKHFQEALSISISQSTLIQATTYLGYFLMAVPAGIYITRYGYRKGVVAGLLLFAIGSLLFIPGEASMSFAIFLIALFVIGCGLVILETAANPYASVLGSSDTAASRLNFAQSFNGLGCILAPVLIGGFLFSENNGSVDIPYAIMGVVVLLAALLFSRMDIPEISNENTATTTSTSKSTVSTIRMLLSDSIFRNGLIALFCYEIAEISINSLFINYTTAEGWLEKTVASAVLSFGALGLFMLARIGGSWIMSRIPAERVLAFCGVMTVLCSLFVVANIGVLSKISLFAIYAFEAIMFPTIFAITIARVEPASVKIASSLLMMTPIGGAVGTVLMGIMADATSMSTSFIIPALGFLFVLIYAGSRLKIRNKICINS